MSNRSNKPIRHCWAAGPNDIDHMPTICMGLRGHPKGQHEWHRQDRVCFTITPRAKAQEERQLCLTDLTTSSTGSTKATSS